MKTVYENENTGQKQNIVQRTILWTQSTLIYIFLTMFLPALLLLKIKIQKFADF